MVTIYEKEKEPYIATIQSYKTNAKVEFTLKKDELKVNEYKITISYPTKKEAEDFIIQLDFTGDSAELYCGKELIGDRFTTGLPYKAELKRFLYPEKLKVKIYPSCENICFDLQVKNGCILNNVIVDTLYKTEIR